MALNEENISKILRILSHQIRRDILILLQKKEQSFSELMSILEIDTGKMSFHLRILAQVIDRTDTGKYKLNVFGKNALVILKDIEALSIDFDFVENKSIHHIAKFSRRAMAFGFDMGVTFIIVTFAYLVAEFFVLFSGQFLFHQNIFVFIGLLWAYSTLLEGYAGQTLGKIMFRLKVVSLSSEKLAYDAAAVRNFGKSFLLPFDLLLGLSLKDKRFVKIFDKYSRTTVIRL
jgi:uncharacterized RDD family membrane protein YckC/DNA-binding transcriptional ArsR family regulator